MCHWPQEALAEGLPLRSELFELVPLEPRLFLLQFNLQHSLGLPVPVPRVRSQQEVQDLL